MRRRITERYDVASVRYRRGDTSRVAEAVETILAGGFVFHVLTFTPEQGEDLYSVLIDGHFVVSFELSRSEGAEPVDVTVYDYEAYRRAIGQGRHRIFLERAAEDACAVLGSNRSVVRIPTANGAENVILSPVSKTLLQGRLRPPARHQLLD